MTAGGASICGLSPSARLPGTSEVGMTSAARTLAEFAVGLHYETLPPEAIACARSIVIDTTAAMTFGATLPWSRIVIDYVRKASPPGKGSVVGTEVKARAPLA